MKIIALEVEKPGALPGQFRPLLVPEAQQLWNLYQEGTVREAYFDAERHAAVLILECSGKNEAQSVLATLPLVQAGLIDFTLIPLAPYDGFARLFADSAPRG